MKVVFALLAEFAKVEADGRFSITGGDIHELKIGTRYTLALAVRLQLALEDLGSDRVIEITSSGPDGAPIARPYSLVVRGQPTVAADNRPLNLPFVYTMEEIAIEHPGVHSVSITSGGSLLETVSFDAIGSVVTPSQSEEPWSAGMRRSYDAWDVGDLDGTLDALTHVVEEFPDLAEAHNNLGFVLLMLKRIHQALSEFNRAIELGFERPEVVLANAGVCYYVLGRPDEAFTRFKYCLTRLTFIDGAWLLGLDDDKTFLQDLPTAIDYVDLITLNSAWAAHRRGDEDEARRALRRAAVSTLRVPDSEFATSVQNLTSKLGPPDIAVRA